MSRVLVIFGTTDGQTGKIADAIGSELRADGHHAVVVDSATTNPDPMTYDAVIVAASVHAGGYQKTVVNWVLNRAHRLNDMPTAFVSVCLGVLQHDRRVDEDLVRIVDAFLMNTGWKPREVKRVAGALKYTRYNFLKRFVMKRIARKAGGGTDTSRDYEYTDWADLRAFADRFSERLRRTVTAATA